MESITGSLLADNNYWAVSITRIVMVSLDEFELVGDTEDVFITATPFFQHLYNKKATL